VIVDGGANIGLTILYFKRLYPASRIVAFEADPAILAILERNLRAHGIGDVTLMAKALAASECRLNFVREGAYASRIARPGDAPDVSVETVRLRRYLEEPVDLLKLNIEGAETEVLVDCADLLGYVRNVAFEYHSFAAEPQRLHSILDLLCRSGFRVHIRPVRSSPQPLLDREVILGMDMQLYVFGFRE
jgi:FkbM family methyltransferase